jgi:DNA-binding NtrC family response regulator
MAARLLVVEDEGALCDLLQRFLERAGYEVEVFSSSQEALARFKAEPGAFSLVITDLSLQPLNGEELLERMRGVDPQLRAVIVSGYPHVPLHPRTGFLLKPFLPKMLLEEIGRALAK